ncbi:MAG: hypothetical protein JST53_18005 [Actinobacteria bacterium]|nr:hypothetical protein [Actinomycetota bacterium]
MTTTLPNSLIPENPSMVVNDSEAFGEGICSSSLNVVSCNYAGPVQPGIAAQVYVPLTVSSVPQPVAVGVKVSGGGAAAAETEIQTAISSSLPSFGFLEGRAGFAVSTVEPSGAFETRAGSHPQQLTVDLGFPTAQVPGRKIVSGGIVAAGHLHDLSVSLPKGMVVNPNATPVRCTEPQLEANACPLGSQVGIVSINAPLTVLIQYSSPIFNMVPAPGAAAELGFEALGVGIFVHLQGGLRPDGHYELAARSNDILARANNPIFGIQAQIWGDPSDRSHDAIRGKCLEAEAEGCTESVAASPTAFVTAPSACSASMPLSAEADSWEAPESVVARDTVMQGSAGQPIAVPGCERLAFEPSISIQPESKVAESPTGLNVNLSVPQHTGTKELASSALKKAYVTLPPGLVVNAAAANGLGACGPGEFEERRTTPGSCPANSKVGQVEVQTQLLDHSLPGSIYVARPFDNPFNSLLAVYLEVNDPVSGIVIKLAGKVEANHETGQLSATFDENPELPFEDFKLNFFGGPQATLHTPATCGNFESNGELVPWSGTAPVKFGDSFSVNQGAGGPCASTEGALPAKATFEAGTVSPFAGSYSPFVLNLRREDGSQQFKALNVTLPPGLTGKLAGVPYCGDVQLAAAAAHSGREEIAHPSCPAASEIGTVSVGAGAGSQPYYVSGKAYLTGPYRGAPLGLAIVTPAVAGPFDLGTVVVRSALFVDQMSAQITVKSDPLPSILEGIPLDLRDIRVAINRPSFSLNPTSCEAKAVTGEALTTPGQTVALDNRFQVGGCKGLDFKPNLKLQLNGATKRAGHPKLKAVLTFPKTSGQANTARAQVSLPHSLFLDQGNLNKVCKQADLRAGTCPKTSVYGHAKAWTPLLDKPLEGPVYLGVGFGYKLPALVADLNGQIRFLLVGKVDTTKKHGLRNTFETVPDAPVSRFVLELKGGKKYGLIENSENLCSRAQKANARFSGQNGAVANLELQITRQCGKRKKTT